MSFVKKAAIILGNFLLPLGVLAFACWVDNLYPFGIRTFLISDMRMQYVDFFAWLHDVFAGQNSLLYSFNGELGGSTAGLIGYYLASPFNALVAFFPKTYLTLFCFVLVALKIGCIQLSVTYFLKKRFQLGEHWSIILALGFSLSSWVLTQYRNPMWLDALILLPLCAWGVYILIHENKGRTLALTYGLTVLTSWYMGFMVGIFLCFYFAFELFNARTDGSAYIPADGKLVLQFVAWMALGLCLSAVIFLPSLCALLDAGTTSGGVAQTSSLEQVLKARIPQLERVTLPLVVGLAGFVGVALVGLLLWKLRKRSTEGKCALLLFVFLTCCLLLCLILPALQHGTVAHVLGALFCGTWIDSKTPQLYGSLLLLICALGYFFSARTSRSAKIAGGLFLYILILSSWLYPLQFIWGGFRVPAGYHSRMSFLFIFMLLWFAASFLSSLIKTQDFLDKKNPLNQLIASKVAFVVVAVLVVVELTLRACFIWISIPDNTTQDEFDTYMNEAQTQVAELENRDPGVYRVEKTYNRLNEHAHNEGLALGINQISSYTSTADQATLSFLSDIGYGEPPFYTYENSSLVADSLLGVKYISAPEAPFGYTDEGYTAVSVPSGSRFFKNPYALPLAYAVSQEVTSLSLNSEARREENISAFANAVAGYDLSLYAQSEYSEGTEGQSPLNMDTFLSCIETLRKGSIVFDEFTGNAVRGTFAATSNQMLLFTIPNQAGWSVTLDGTPVEPQDVCNGALMAIPILKDSDTHTLEMHFEPPGLVSGAILTALAICVLLFWKKLTYAFQACRISCFRSSASSELNS